MRSETGMNLTWLGPTDGPCARLLERIRETCVARGRRLRVHVEPLDSPVLRASLASFDSPVVAWADRVIVACETRLDYPWWIIERLERLDACAPWGIVTAAWHAGSRRTGTGPVPHWHLPWYRWWDGWRGWLFPELARPGSRAATQFEPVTLPIDLATPARESAVDFAGAAAATGETRSTSEPVIQLVPGPPRQIMIVTACRETLQAWQLSAAKVSWDWLDAHPQQSDRAISRPNAPALDCILWDDTCQDRLPGADSGMHHGCRQIAELRRRYPSVPVVAGLSVAHLSAWEALQRAGASDFVIKPSFGLPLADYLWARDQDTKTNSPVPCEGDSHDTGELMSPG